MTENREPTELLPLTMHLEELRWRLILCLLYLLLGAAAGLFLWKYLLLALKYPAGGLIGSFIITKPTESVTICIKISLYFGFLVSLPLILDQAFKFIKPAFGRALTENIYLWFAGVISLFACGTVFTYFVLAPFALKFLTGLTNEIAVPMYSLNSYISFMLALLLAGGLLFEMPAAAALLTKAGILTPGFMRAKRKFAYFGIVVLSAVITPTTDAFNMMLFCVPALALYEISIFVSAAAAKRNRSHLLEEYDNGQA